jgi:hypothetical protein
VSPPRGGGVALDERGDVGEEVALAETGAVERACSPHVWFW